MAISQEIANSLIALLLGRKDYSSPTDWYFGVCQSPIVNGLLTTNSEPKEGTGYERKQIPNTQLVGANNGSFTVPISDVARPLSFVTNAQTLTMNEITSGTEPTVKYFFLSDSAQNSNAEGASKKVSLWGTFDRERKLSINSNLTIEPGGAVFEVVNID